MTIQTLYIGTRPKIGIFGIGLAAYWPQFPSLHNRLTVYMQSIEKHLGAWHQG